MQWSSKVLLVALSVMNRQAQYFSKNNSRSLLGEPWDRYSNISLSTLDAFSPHQTFVYMSKNRVKDKQYALSSCYNTGTEWPLHVKVENIQYQLIIL